MAIDLNGSSVAGQNYITSYREDDPAIGIVSSDVRVGSGSSSVNTDNIRHIRISLTQAHGEDEWVIGTMPAGILVSLMQNGPAITVPFTLNALTAPSFYLRTDGRPMPDADWQTALKAIGFFADETIAPSREIVIQAQNSAGAWQAPVATQINITANNDAPNTTADAGEAIEAGGVNNTTPGSNATGNVLTNDWDMDSPMQDTIVSLVSFGGSSTDPGSSISGAFGTLTLQADGSYTYVVDNNNATVQGLRNDSVQITDTFTYMATDAGGASSSNTLTITIKGKDDTPFGIAVGQHFDGTAASVVTGPTLPGVSRDFAFELRVSPTNGIVLHAASLTGAAGTSGQEFAVTPLHGQTAWGSTEHVGVGLSVGTNGISVYQHTGNLLSSLLTWSGTVSANTHVAVVFNDNRPSLYVNGVLVATGLQSNKLMHPPTELGGNGWGYYDGGISDFVVWHGALSAEDVAVRSLDPSLSDSATPALTMLLVSVPENAVEGTVVTTVRARDVDSSEVLTYSLTNDAQGRFLINAATGVVSVAPGAVFDHETAHEITLTAKVTDLANQSVLHNFTVTIGNVNEAPVLINDAVDVSAGLITLMVDQDHGLWWLDGLGGQRSFIASADAPITALARTAQGLYFATSADTLYQLDPTTGHCLGVGALSASGSPQMTGLTAAPDGMLYGVNSVDNLFRIDPATGAATALVALNSSASSHGDVAHANGALYWITVFGDLMRYDLGTGQHAVAMTGLPTQGGIASLSSLMADGASTLYAVSDVSRTMYRIDLVEHLVTAVDTLLPLHTAGQSFVDGTAILSSGNVFANDPTQDPGDTRLVTHVTSESPSGTSGSAGTTVSGAYGTLLLKADGSYVYEVNAAHTAVKALKNPGETLEERFGYTVNDATGMTSTAELVVTVRGFNHAPEVVSEFVSAIEAGGVLNGTPGHNPSGNVLANDNDPDNWDPDGDGDDDGPGPVRLSRVLYQGTPLGMDVPQVLSYGTFQIDEQGNYSYVVNQTHPAVEALRTNLNTLSETITYQVADAHGATQTGTLTIRIEGRDDAPVAIAETAIAVEAGGVHNTTPGQNPTGTVIHASTDVDDTPAQLRVTQARTQVNLIRNGSFEQAPATADGGFMTNAMPYWTNPADSVNFLRDNNASDGRVSIDLDSWTAVDSLLQTGIPTQSGKTYELQFDLSPRAGYGGTTVQVYWNEQFVGNAYVNGDGWTTATFQVTALGNDSLRLAELASENTTGGPRIDNVRLYRTGVDQALVGQYGTLTLSEDGSYQYNVDQSNAQVQALRRPEDTLQESFTYTLTDAAGLTSTSTLAVTVQGKNDTPEAIVLGRIFNGDSASVITGTPSAASRDFSFQLNVSPLETITLQAQSLSGVAGAYGQHYALSPLLGSAVWGNSDHVGLGLSVGSNGISVYQHTGNLLSSLLTWSGAVGPNTQVAVNVIDNRPSLYVNGQLVATGLQSDKLLHPPTEVGGITWGYFKGSIHDVQVWNGALTWNNGVATPPASTPLYSAATLSVNENSAAGTVVTGLRSSDIDAGDTLTYSLVDDGGGRFVVNATTGVVSVAPGAVLDHEAVGSFTLTARVTDTGGLFQEISFTVQIADVNEAPTGANIEAVMNEDNQVRFDASRAEDMVVGGVNVTAVRIDSLPAGGSLTLDGQPVVVGQIMAATDALRLSFKPSLFNAWAQSLSDPDNGDHVQAVRIVSLPSPSQGQLLFNGQPIGIGTDVIAVADLGKLSFEPALNYNGDASFTYRAIDSHGMAQQGNANTFTIHVLPVNDTPVIAPTLTTDVHEGAATHVSGLSVSDVDVGTGEMTVTLRVDEGTLLATSTASVTVEGGGSQQIQLRGTRDALNAFLADAQGVQYLSAHHEPPTYSVTSERLSPEGVADPLVRARFTTSGGRFLASAADGISITGNESQTLTVEGLASKVGPYVTAGGVVREVPIPQARLTMTVSDEGHEGSDPGLTGTDFNEQDVRVIGLSIVPAGLPLNLPEIDTGTTGNAAGAEPTGSTSAQTVAGVAVGASLVIGLGLLDKIKNVITGTAEEAAAAETWIARELGEESHRLSGDVRHKLKEFFKFAEPPVALPGEPVPPVTPPPAAPFPFPLLPFLAAPVTVITQIVIGSNQTQPQTQVNQRPDATGPGEINGLEDRSVSITGLHFTDPDAGDGSVQVTFKLPPDRGVLEASATQQVQVLGNFSDTLTLLGTLTAINAFVAATPGVQFLPDDNVSGQIDLSITINDLGNTGTDPGTSGDANSEETAIVVTLQLAPVSDAPEGHDGRLEIEYQTSHVITEEMLGFADIDQDSFIGIQITELPTHGELMFDGQPMLLNTVISAQDLQNNELVFIDGSDASGSSASPRMGFRVLDSGSTDHDGQTVAAHPSYLSFDVQYPPTLTVETSTAAFNEADGQSLHFVAATLSDRTDPPHAIGSILIDTGTLAYGDSWGFDPAWLASISAQGPLPFERIDQGAGSTLITLTNGATPSFAQQLLNALVFEVQAPNATEGTRSFNVMVFDVDGRNSETAVIELEVVSVLGTLIREVQANEQALQQRANLALPPTAEEAAADAHAALSLLQSRERLAQAVWQALAEAEVTLDGGLKVGVSLDLALQTLGLGHGESLITNMTEPSADALSGDWFTQLIRDPATNTLWLPEEQRTVLLAWAEQQRTGARQQASAQFIAAIDSPESIEQAGESSAWRIPAGGWLIDAAFSMAGLSPVVVEASDPWTVWSTQPDAWVLNTQGQLHLSDASWQQLRMAVEVQHYQVQNHNGVVELLAIKALQEALPQDNHLLVDLRLANWLTAAGMTITLQADPGDGSQPWMTQPNVIVQTAEGLRMSPITHIALQKQLLERLDAPDASDSPGLQLFHALAASIDAEGAPQLPAEARAWLESLGLRVRWVDALDPQARPGQIAQSAPGQPLILTEGTRDSLYAQLLAWEAAPSGNEPAGPIGSELLQVKRVLDAAEESPLFTGLHAVKNDEVVVQWLQGSGMSVVDISRYHEMGMTDALARLVARKEVAVFDPATQTLHLSDSVFKRLGAMAGLALAQSLQTEVEQGPLAPETNAETPTVSHQAALQLGPQMTPAGDATQAWAATFAGLRLLAGSAAHDAPSLDQPVTNVQLINESLVDDAVSILAQAGIAVRDLGPWNELDAQGQAALRDAAHPAVARDAWGNPFIDSTVLQTLTNRLLAQSYAEQAELARNAIEDLMVAHTGAAVPMVSEGVATTHIPRSVFAAPGFVTRIDAALLFTLQRLGIAPASIEVVDGYLTNDQVQNLEQDAGHVVVDRRSGTAWIHEDTQSQWLSDLADRMQAAHVARYTLDPAAITDPAHTGDPVGMAYRVALTGPGAIAWTSTPVADGVVRISINLAALNQAHLAFRWIHGFEDNATTHEALKAARLGTVMTDPAQPDSVVMSAATWAALLAQSSHIHASQGDWPTDPQTMGSQLLATLHAQAVLANSIVPPDATRVWVEADAHLLAALQAAGLSPVLLGDVAVLDAAAQLQLDNQTGTYATTNSGLQVSVDTLSQWKEALANHANLMGSPAVADLSWTDAEPALIHDDSALTSQETRQFNTIETQLAALLVDGAREEITTTEGSAFFWHIEALDGRLNTGQVRNLLQESDETPFAWVSISPSSPADFSALLAGQAIVGQAPDGSLYLSDTAYQMAMKVVQSHVQEAREDLAQAVFEHLLNASEHTDWYHVPQGTALQDLHTLLPAGLLHEVAGKHPQPGEVGIDDQGGIWLHGATRLQVLNAIGQASATDNPAQAETLSALLNQATAHVGVLGIYSIDAAAASLLANAGFELAVNGSFSDSVLGYQNLGDAGNGRLQLGGDGRIYLTDDTLAALRALAGGQTTAQAPDSVDVLTSVKLLNYLSELANDSVSTLFPQPLSGEGLQAAKTGWWQHLRDWVVLDGPGTQTDGLRAQVGLPADIYETLREHAVPVRKLQLTSDDALLAALQSGELHSGYTIIEDAAGNHLMSQATRELLLDWITSQVERTNGMDWREQYGLDQDSDASGGVSKRALLNQQQTNSTLDALYLETGTVMNAVLHAQNGSTGTVRLNISAAAFQEWLDDASDLGLQMLNITGVGSEIGLDDGQFAQNGTQLVMTDATAAQVLGAAHLTASALLRDSAATLVHGLSSRTGYSVNNNSFIVVKPSEAFNVVRDSLPSLEMAMARDSAGERHEVRFEDLVSVQESYVNASNSTTFLASSTNVTLASGTVVALRNDDIVKAYDALMERGQQLTRNADGDWVMSESTREWTVGKSAQLAAQAPIQAAEKLQTLLEEVITNGTISVVLADALPLLKAVGAAYLETTNVNDINATLRLVNMGDGTAQMSEETGAALLELAKAIQSKHVDVVQSQLSLLNDAVVLYEQVDLTVQLADIDPLPNSARSTEDAFGKRLVSVDLDPALWSAFGKGAADTTTLPIQGPLSAADQATWNSLYAEGSVKVFTDAQGSYRYVMTAETWSGLLTELDRATKPNGDRAVVHVPSEEASRASFAASSALQIVNLADVNGTSADVFLDFVQTSALVAGLPVGTALRTPDGALWMSSTTANLAKTQLRAELTAGSTLDDVSATGTDLSARLQAHGGLIQALDAAAPVETDPTGWDGHLISTGALTTLQTLGVHMQQVAGTNPSVLAGSAPLSYVVDGEGNVWISPSGYALLNTLEDTVGHALNAELLGVRWEAVPGQDLWMLDDNSQNLEWLQDRAGISLVDGGSFANQSATADLPLNTFVRDAQGRIYVSEATYQTMAPAIERAALAERSHFQEAVQAGLHEATVNTQPTLVLVTDNVLYFNIIHSSNAKQLTGTFTANDLTAQQHKDLSDPGSYNYTLVPGGLLIGLDQLNALARLPGSNIDLVNVSQYEVVEPMPVVTIDHPLLTQWLVEMGYRFGELLDSQGVPLPSQTLQLSELDDGQRAQLEAQPGLIVQGANGQLLMSQETWQEVMTRSMVESTMSQASLAQQAQRGLLDAELQELPGGQNQTIATLAGNGKEWLEVFDSLGMAYRLVDALGTSTNANAINPTALFGASSGDALPVGLDSQNRLVMSDATLERLTGWAREFGNLFELNSLQLQALGNGAADADFTRLPQGWESPSNSLLGDWQGGAAGIRLMYGTITVIRALMNREMAADSIIKGNLSKVGDALKGYSVHELNELIGKYNSEMANTSLLSALVKLKTLLEAEELRTILGGENEVELAAMGKPYFNDQKLLQIFNAANTFLTDLGSTEIPTDNDTNQARKEYAQTLTRRLEKFYDLLELYQDYNLDIYTKAFAKEYNGLFPMDAFRNTVKEKENELGTLMRFMGRILDTKQQMDSNALTEDYLQGLKTDTEAAFNWVRGFFESPVENILRVQIAEEYTTAVMDREMRAISESDEYKNFLKIDKASQAFQIGRTKPSLATFLTHTPAALADAINNYRLLQTVYPDTPEGLNLYNKYLSQTGLASVNGLSAFFSAAQFPTWGSFRSGADMDTYSANYYSAGTYEGSGFVLWPASGGIPMQAIYKGSAIDLGGTAKLEDKILSKENNLHPNIVYQLSDWSTMLGGAASAVLWSYQNTPLAKYMQARNAVSTLAGAALIAGDAGGSGYLAYRWYKNEWSDPDSAAKIANAIYFTNSWGGRSLALGHFLNGYALVAADAFVIPHLWWTNKGVSLGAALDAIYPFLASWGATFAINAGFSAANSLIPTWIKPDFSSLQNAWELWPVYREANATGRGVEESILLRQMVMELIRGTFGVNVISGATGLAESIYYGALGAGTSIEEFKTAVQQRLDALENHPQPDENGVTMKLSARILKQAQQMGVVDYSYDISNSVDDFTFAQNPNVKVMKSVLVATIKDGEVSMSPAQFFSSNDQIAGVASGNNLSGQHLIKIELPNDTGGLVNYTIRPDAEVRLADIGTTVSGPLMLIDASKSTVDSTNQFMVFNSKVAIHGGRGEDLYLLGQSLRPQVVANYGNELVAGYIRDGIVSVGRDTVSWRVAQSTDAATQAGHSIHMGTGAEGFAAYQGIQHFFGSGYNDVITRYGSTMVSNTLYSIDGGGGNDVFDLRSGDNLVTVAAGSVHFDLSSVSEAMGINRDTMLGQGVYADQAYYGTLFSDQFAGNNFNMVTIQQHEAGLVKVFGNRDSHEQLTVDFGGLGLRAEYRSDVVTIDGTAFDKRYELTAISTAVSPAPSLRGVADLQIDSLFGTVYDDTVIIGNGATLKQVHGAGGNDTVDVDVAGIGVYLAAGNSVVRLGSNASGATLVLGEGNEAIINTTSGAAAPVNVTVYGGDLLDTYVDARESTQALHVDSQSGKVMISQGYGASEIRVQEAASMVKVVDNLLSTNDTLKFLLQDNGDFSINDLITDDGQLGKFLHTVQNGANVYSTNWYNEYGDFTVLQFQGDDIANVSLEVAGISGSYLLSNLIAMPMPEPAPAPV
ncbi:VCBS domain-containing protein [Hydrogenophaga sp.]|uniref:VCBS domain-containing protein n=1 Tax=Hydrogenophaga sp. TaxID=1904254 RepID=UPI002FCB5D0B